MEKTQTNWKIILIQSYVRFVARRYLTIGLIIIGVIAFYILPTFHANNRITQLESMSKSNIEWIIIYLISLLLLVAFFYIIQKTSHKYHKKAKESFLQAFDLVKGNIKALQGVVIIGSTLEAMDLLHSKLYLQGFITMASLLIITLVLCCTETIIEELVTNKIGKCITVK